MSRIVQHFVFATVCITTTATYGFDVVISTTNPSGNQGSPIGFSASTAVAFDTNNLSSAAIVIETTGNLDAFHVRDDGNLLLSVQTGFDLGGATFEDGQIAEYDIGTDTASLFLDFETILDDSVDIEIDAFAELPDGQVLFSTGGDGAMGIGPNAGLQFTNSDIVIFNPSTLVASIFLNDDVITDGDRFNNVNGVSWLNDGRIAMSVTTGGTPEISIGGIQFQRNDVVLFDPVTQTATVAVEGSSVFEGPPVPGVNAVHVNTSVPEPSATWLVILGVGGVARRLRRSA